MLAYLDVRPRTSYLGRVRNPNPAMPGAQYIGHTSVIEEDAGSAPASTPASGASTATPDATTGNHADAKKLNLETLTG